MTADSLFNLRKAERAGGLAVEKLLHAARLFSKTARLISPKIRERLLRASRCRRRPRAMPQYSLYFHNRYVKICANVSLVPKRVRVQFEVKLDSESPSAEIQVSNIIYDIYNIS